MTEKYAPRREALRTTPEEWRGVALILQAFVVGMLLCVASVMLLPASEPVPIGTIGWFLLVLASILVGVGGIVSFLPIAKPSRR